MPVVIWPLRRENDLNRTPPKQRLPNSLLNIGIIVPSNNRAGPQKLAALAAMDLSRHGCRLQLFVPRLPYYYYFVTLRKKRMQWVRLVRHYVTAYVRNRSYSFQDLIDTCPKTVSERISIKNVCRCPLKNQMKGLDAVLVMTIAQVVELESLYPQEKTIYQIHHPEEIIHGHHDTLHRIRKAFRGRTIAISPWTAQAVSDHIEQPPVVPDVVSTVFWKNRYRIESGKRKKDILFHFSSGHHKGGEKGLGLIRAIKKLRPDTTVTVWNREGVPLNMNFPTLTDMKEGDLLEQYTSHKLLLFPSTMEGFGMPPVEAMACGCVPILNAHVGASDLYASDYHTTILIDPDTDQTAKKIIGILDDEDTLKKIRMEAFRAIEPFTPNGYGIRLLKAAGFEM